MTRDEIVTVGTAMKRYGGGFVASLGEAILRADGEKVRRIRQAFPELWERYFKEGIEAAGGRPNRSKCDQLREACQYWVNQWADGERYGLISEGDRAHFGHGIELARRALENFTGENDG